MDQSDERLLGELATDLNRHYELLWHTYLDGLYTYVQRHTNNRQDAEDLLQDIAIRVYTALRGYSPDKIRLMASWLRPWLYKVARSALLDALEKQNKQLVSRSFYPDEDPWLDKLESVPLWQPEQLLESKELRQEIEEIVATLPEKYREVICLHYFDGLKLTEIADLLQEPAPTIRQKQHRALVLRSSESTCALPSEYRE